MTGTRFDAGNTAGRRVIAVDVMRGALVAGMILVNSPGNAGSVLPQLKHVEWSGGTFADVIAPAFLWIVGVTAALSLSRRTGEQSVKHALRHIAIRGAGIYTIGVLIPLVSAAIAGPPWSVLDSVKLMGILQRIGLAYLLAAPIILCASSRNRALIAAALLAFYLIILLWIPGPLTEGGTFAPWVNAVQWLDRVWLGGIGEPSSHALPTLIPAAALILLGSLMGDLIGRQSARFPALIALFAGVATLLLGWGIDTWIPIIRRILSCSFVLMVAGAATIILTLMYLIIDKARWYGGLLAFRALGTNALLFFAASELARGLASVAGSRDTSGAWASYWTLAFELLERHWPAAWASALMAFAFTAAFIPAAIFLHQRRLFIKL